MPNLTLDSYLAGRGRRFYQITIGGGVVLLLGCFWLWWHFGYLGNQSVFWGAMTNNLRIAGVTKENKSSAQGQGFQQTDQIVLGAQNVVKSVGVVSETNNNQEVSRVVTETLATPNANFSRYTAIKTSQVGQNGKPFNFGPVLNVWAKQDANSGNNAFTQAVLDIAPLANLSPKQQQQVIAQMKRDNTYQVDFNAVTKRTVSGKTIYDYNVNVSAEAYFKTAKLIDAMMGLNQLKSVDPAQYKNAQPVQFVFSVDARAHQLAGITYVSNQRTETFSNYGAQPKIDIPSKTITGAELQARLAKIVTGQ